MTKEVKGIQGELMRAGGSGKEGKGRETTHETEEAEAKRESGSVREGIQWKERDGKGN